MTDNNPLNHWQVRKPEGSNPPPPGPPDQTAPSTPSYDDLARTLNTAMVSSRSKQIRDFSTELCSLVESPPFKSILGAIHELAVTQQISPQEAATAIIETFQDLDRLWSDYLLQEGLDHLKGKPRS